MHDVVSDDRAQRADRRGRREESGRGVGRGYSLLQEGMRWLAPWECLAPVCDRWGDCCGNSARCVTEHRVRNRAAVAERARPGFGD